MTRTRRTRGGLALALAVGTLGLAPAAHANPEPGSDFDATWGGEPFYEEQQLATNGEGGWPNYRIPALTVTNDGDVLASYDGRPTGADSPGPNSILQQRSTDNGQTWQEPTVVREGQTQEPIEGYSDPSYIVDRETGSIFNFHVFSLDRGFRDSQPGVDPEDRDVIHANVARSDDNGQTWSHETITADITDAEEWRSRFAAAGQGIQLKYGEHAGRLIQQYTIINDDLDGAYQAVSIYSDDHGETWQAGEPVGVGMDENKTVELSDGRVMLNSRDSHGSGYRKVAISEDGGETYGEVVVDQQLPDPTNNASIIRAFPNAPEGSAEAQVLLFSNAGSTTARANGVVRMSCDDGQTWPVSKVFQPGGMAYSTLVTQADGTIGLLYEPEGGNGGIRYANFNLAWLDGICAGLSAETVSVAAGAEFTVPVTIDNSTGEALSGGTLALDAPSGWSSSSVDVDDIAAGTSVVIDVPVVVPGDAFAGQYSLAATFSTDQGTSHGEVIVTVDTDEDAVITVVPRHVNPADEYVRGDVVRFDYEVMNLSDQTVAVVPEGDLEEFDPRTSSSPNCRFGTLGAGQAYTCGTAYHVLTQADLDAGSFTPETTWRVHAGSPDGELLDTLERNAPTVDLPVPANLIPQDQLDVVDFSSEEVVNADAPASATIDGDATTIWHSQWSDSTGPHHIAYDLGGTYEVQALRYLARQSGNTNGMIENYAIYVSSDGQDWGEPAATGTSPNSRDVQVFDLPEGTEGRYVKLEFLSSHSDGGQHFASAAEVNVQGVLPAEEPTIEALRSSLDQHIADGSVDGPIAHQLQNALDQAERHLAGERTQPALVALERFIRHVDNPKRPDTLTDEAATDLREQADALHELIG